MKMIRTFVLLLTVTPVLAQASRLILPGEQWVRLFNGKHLTGWVKVGNEKWEVEDGAIHGPRNYQRVRLFKNRGKI